MAKAENFFGATDTGRQRSNNEDAFIARALEEGTILACVIDGVGGYEGGEVAAAIARDTLLESFRNTASNASQLMKKAFELANERIYRDRLQHPERNNMACVLTAVLADTRHNQFHYAHVGDTRLYLLRDDSLVKLSKDHSFVGFLEDNKKISEQEAMSHPKRNEVNKALGFDPNMSRVTDYIETGSSPFLPGDLLMLCSDGLTDLVDHQTMSRLLSSPLSLQEKTGQLIQAANDAGGKDNITVVLVQNNNKSIKLKRTKPTVTKKEQPAAAGPGPSNTTMTTVPVYRKRNPTFSIILFLLCLLLGAATYYLWKENRELRSPSEAEPAVQASMNANEKRLLDSLEVSPFLFLDSSYGSEILITDTILVQRDSLYVNGNGIVFRNEGNFKGPLFAAGEDGRYIFLENLVIDGFDIGLLAQAKILRLQNVIFRNCRIPVQQQFRIAQNLAVSGVLVDSVLFKPDSIAKRQR